MLQVGNMAANPVSNKEMEETVEERALRQLRIRIQDVIEADEKFNDDYYLLQWLKARHMHPANTETMIRNSIKWRKENDIDRLLHEDFPKDMWEQFKIYLNDWDKNGIPMSSIPVGTWKVREHIEKHGKTAFLRYLSQIFMKSEKLMIELNKKNNKNNPPGTRITSSSSNGLTTLISAEHYSMKQARSLKAIMAVVECSKQFDAYFPQIVEKAYVIHVDSFFTFIVKLVTPFLCIPAIHVFDTDESSWKPFVLDRIDAEQIYPEFGGTRTTKHQGVVFSW